MYSYYGEQYKNSLKRLKIELSYDSANPTPGHISKENHNSKRYSTPVFSEALFTIARMCKQPKCPSTDEWIKKICYRDY